MKNMSVSWVLLEVTLSYLSQRVAWSNNHKQILAHLRLEPSIIKTVCYHLATPYMFNNILCYILGHMCVVLHKSNNLKSLLLFFNLTAYIIFFCKETADCNLKYNELSVLNIPWVRCLDKTKWSSFRVTYL